MVLTSLVEEAPIDPVDEARRMDFARQVHSYVTENVRIADSKAGFVAAAAGRVGPYPVLRLSRAAAEVEDPRDAGGVSRRGGDGRAALRQIRRDHQRR